MLLALNLQYESLLGALAIMGSITCPYATLFLACGVFPSLLGGYLTETELGISEPRLEA